MPATIDDVSNIQAIVDATEVWRLEAGAQLLRE